MSPSSDMASMSCFISIWSMLVPSLSCTKPPCSSGSQLRHGRPVPATGAFGAAVVACFGGGGVVACLVVVVVAVVLALLHRARLLVACRSAISRCWVFSCIAISLAVPCKLCTIFYALCAMQYTLCTIGYALHAIHCMPHTT